MADLIAGSRARSGPCRLKVAAPFSSRRGSTGEPPGPSPYSGSVATTEGSPGPPGAAPGTTLAPARPAPDLDDGDHDRMAHIVLEGYSPKEGGDFVSLGPSVVEGMVNRTPVRALCGKEWVPGRDPARYGLCPTCKEIAESMGWQLPVR